MSSASMSVALLAPLGATWSPIASALAEPVFFFDFFFLLLDEEAVPLSSAWALYHRLECAARIKVADVVLWGLY
jgi:hypothetical protein